jgi:hypothetical protein
MPPPLPRNSHLIPRGHNLVSTGSPEPDQAPDAILKQVFHMIVTQAAVLRGKEEMVCSSCSIPVWELLLNVPHYVGQMDPSCLRVARIEIPARRRGDQHQGWA